MRKKYNKWFELAYQEIRQARAGELYYKLKSIKGGLELLVRIAHLNILRLQKVRKEAKNKEIHIPSAVSIYLASHNMRIRKYRCGGKTIEKINSSNPSEKSFLCPKCHPGPL